MYILIDIYINNEYYKVYNYDPFAPARCVVKVFFLHSFFLNIVNIIYVLYGWIMELLVRSNEFV